MPDGVVTSYGLHSAVSSEEEELAITATGIDKNLLYNSWLLKKHISNESLNEIILISISNLPHFSFSAYIIYIYIFERNNHTFTSHGL
jgi:hypothetical protein